MFILGQRLRVESVATDDGAVASRDAPRPVGFVHQGVNGALKPELPCRPLAIIHQQTAEAVSSARRMYGHRLDNYRASGLSTRRLHEIRDAEDEADELPVALREKDELGHELGTDRSVGGNEGLERDGAIEEIARERLKR